MPFQFFKNVMQLFLYCYVPIKVIVILFPMVYCVLNHLIRNRCHVINIIWSKLVITQGQISLPDIATTLTNLSVCPSGIICKYGIHICPKCIPISQLSFRKMSVCFQICSSNNSTCNQNGITCNHLPIDSILLVQWIVHFSRRYKVLTRHI